MSLLVHVMFYPFCVRFLSLYCIHCLFSLFTCSFVTCEIQYQSINQSITCTGRGAERASSDDQFTRPTQLLECGGDSGTQWYSLLVAVVHWNHVVVGPAAAAAAAASRIIGQRPERVGNETGDARRHRRRCRSVDEETQELGSLGYITTHTLV